MFHSVGTRVACEQGDKRKRGIVRFAGELPGTGKYRVGVEWDNDGEGLHDGTLFTKEEGGSSFKLFDCPPSRGSFVNPAKLLLPQSLHQALVERYGDHLANPCVVCLEFSQVGLVSTTHGTDSHLCVGQATEVNVSGTLFGTWNELLSLLQAFPSLEKLIACNNPNLPFDGSDTFVGNVLATLALNGCHGVPLSLVLSRLDAPSLRELHLSDLQLDRIPQGVPSTVELMDLSKNQLSALDEESFALLPKCLKTLRLDLNPNCIITNTGVTMDSVLHLSLDGTLVEKWAQVDQMALVFPNVKELKLRKVPLLLLPTTLSVEEVKLREDRHRIQTIRRFQGIQVLNGSLVTPAEQRDASISSASASAKQDRVAKRRSLVLKCEFRWHDKSVVRPLVRSTQVDELFSVFERLLGVKPEQLAVQVGQEQVRVRASDQRCRLGDLIGDQQTCAIFVQE